MFSPEEARKSLVDNILISKVRLTRKLAPIKIKTTQQAADETRQTSSHAGEKFFENAKSTLSGIFPSIGNENTKTDYRNFMRPTVGQNSVGSSIIPSYKILQNAGNFLDGLLFNKASANAITSFCIVRREARKRSNRLFQCNSSRYESSTSSCNTNYK